MARVVWRREALDDLREVIRYIRQFDPAAAQSVGDRLYDLGQSLDAFPRRGRPLEDGTREMASEPPYILRYETEGEQVVILSIRHGRQRPPA